MVVELRQIPTVELRFDGGVVRGVVMPYGRPGKHPSGMVETFDRGAFRWWDVALNVGHTKDIVATIGDGRLKLAETADGLVMEALTDRADEIREGIESRRLGGLSVEFRAVSDSVSAGVRTVHAAVLDGIGIVRHPAYQDATVEVRRRTGGQKLWPSL